MNREDRELLVELRRLNSDVVPFAMKIMDESVTVTVEEQCAFAERLMTMERRLEARAATTGMVVEGEATTVGSISCPSVPSNVSEPGLVLSNRVPGWRGGEPANKTLTS